MKKIFSTLLLSSLIAPSLVFALQPVYRTTKEYTQAEEKIVNEYNETEKRARVAKEASQIKASSTSERGFCAQIDKALIYVDIKSTTHEEKKVEKITKREEKRDESRAQVDTLRNENEIKRKTQFDELTKRATTSEQKAAVAQFIVTINKALADKKTATDAVISTHRKEVDQEMNTRKIDTAKALVTLKTTIEAAKSKANADCTNGVPGTTVKKNLKDSIQEAQSVFQKTVKPLAQYVSTTKNNTQKKELQTIERAFKKSVEQSKKELKASFNTQTRTGASSTRAN